MEATDGAFNAINPQERWVNVNANFGTESSSYGIAVLDSTRVVPRDQENVVVHMPVSSLLRIA